jgi:hypothetical protein
VRSAGQSVRRLYQKLLLPFDVALAMRAAGAQGDPGQVQLAVDALLNLLGQGPGQLATGLAVVAPGHPHHAQPDAGGHVTVGAEERPATSRAHSPLPVQQAQSEGLQQEAAPFRPHPLDPGPASAPAVPRAAGGPGKLTIKVRDQADETYGPEVRHLWLVTSMQIKAKATPAPSGSQMRRDGAQLEPSASRMPPGQHLAPATSVSLSPLPAQARAAGQPEPSQGEGKPSRALAPAVEPEQKPSLARGLEGGEAVHCEGCGYACHEDRLVQCKRCCAWHHSYCLSPPLWELPLEGWQCAECVDPEWHADCVRPGKQVPGSAGRGSGQAAERPCAVVSSNARIYAKL